MKSYPYLKRFVIFISFLCLLIALRPLSAQMASQEINLIPGWNSIWLEVEPTHTTGPQKGLIKSPEQVFSGIDGIEITVTSPKPEFGTSEGFASDPSDITSLNQSDWEQWSKPARPGDNLSVMAGNRPYLIKTKKPVTLLIEGRVKFHRPVWNPDRFNLIGFGLQDSPTFQEFFSASGTTHDPQQIYKLDRVSGAWVKIASPEAERMRSNEAYWVYSSGPSKYMGPVAVDFDTAVGGILNFGGSADAVEVDSSPQVLQLDLEELTFTNLRDSGVAAPELDLISQDSGSGDLVLKIVAPGEDALSYTVGGQVDSSAGPTAGPSNLLESVPAGGTRTLTLGASREWSSGTAGRTNVYRISTGSGGASFWLPVSASRSDIAPPTDLIPDSASAFVVGLWVGEISATDVTSMVEDGAPVKRAAASAPIRIIFHSDDNGTVRLLSQVTIMQSKTADPELPSAPVLVIDQKQIPFFEGIQERNGKRLGFRIESVAFDLPRNVSPTAQGSGLLSAVVAESTSASSLWKSGAGLFEENDSVTAEGIESYLLFRGIRPPSLRETYHTSLRCDGAMGAGKTVRTRPNTLVMDSFHRSNPFRHAYHQKHTKGPQITREISITFDDSSTSSDSLTGVYEEQLVGLTKSSLTVRGRVKLRRLNSVPSLEGLTSEGIPN